MIFNTSFQIGNRFALTAAHCLYDDDNEEVLPVTTFSIMLGLHDRRKTKEPNRWLFRFTKGLRFTLVCKPNFGNARILGAYGRPTHPELCILIGPIWGQIIGS